VPAGYDQSQFPPFAVTVDVVILTMVDARLHVLLVRRTAHPYEGSWSLPGGFKRPHETLDEAAARELEEETGVVAPAHLAQFRAYGDPGRDPRTNVVTVAYLAVTPEVGTIVAGTDADDARLWPVAEAVQKIDLAFDHSQILEDAISAAAQQLEQSDLATAFLGPKFTLSELQSVYEELWHERLDAANFRRQLSTRMKAAYIAPTGEVKPPSPKGGRPAELYRAGPAWQASPPVRRSRKTRPKSD
jgi:8-oxo-dGTP diphosphatase